MASNDFAVAQEFLQQAVLVVVPEDQTQRQAFSQLMPQIFVLRRKGCSFRQLATLLAQCGLKLQPDTVRRYYAEMLAERMDACEKQMNTQIEILAAVKRETQGIDLKAIAGMVDQTMAQRKADASAKLALMVGAGNQPVPTPVVNTYGAPAPMDPTTQDNNGGEMQRGSAPATTRQPAPTASKTPAQRPAVKSAVPPGEAPTIPQLGPRTPVSAPTPTAAASTHSPKLKCAALKQGIQQVKKRENMPAEVYEPGQLEHPAIPNLFLNLEERLYGASLELINMDEDDGSIRLETMQEKRFRVLWKTPVPPEQTRTGKDFTKMDMTLFQKP